MTLMASGGPIRPSKVRGVAARQVSIDNRNTPPYWQIHRRTSSALSTATVSAQISHRPPIALEDHTEECSESCGPLWAKQVNIDDYAIITGNSVGTGTYVVWNCTIEMLDVSASLSKNYHNGYRTDYGTGRAREGSEEVRTGLS